jgi:holo-[acyl-carrier protein] synthase
MVLGIGIDIIEIERIKESIEKLGDRFLNKIYTKKELEYCNSKANKYQHYAARFAAKEAIYKAISSLYKEGIGWHEVEIFNEPNGMPSVKLFGKLKNFLGDDKELKITMSHSNNYVTCFAILYIK